MTNNFEIWCTESTYWTTAGGDNCPLSSVIVTEGKCIEATSQLGLSYHGISKSDKVPAGCWDDSQQPQGSAANAYFNPITDPSLADPSWSSQLHGVCGTIGSKHLIILHFVF